MFRSSTPTRSQRQFSAGTCPGAYGDLEALLRPSTAIPSYPADGPAFLSPEFQGAEAFGYRFELTATERAEGCPSKAWRRYAYAATPTGPGRHLLVGTDARGIDDKLRSVVAAGSDDLDYLTTAVDAVHDGLP